MVIAVYLVSHAFEFAMASFDVAQNLVAKAAGVINTSSNLYSSEFTAMIEALKEKEVGELIVISLETSLVKMLIQGVSILITIIVYGRMFEIYVYSAVAVLDSELYYEQVILGVVEKEKIEIIKEFSKISEKSKDDLLKELETLKKRIQEIEKNLEMK